jgi:hypothetical protein
MLILGNPDSKRQSRVAWVLAFLVFGVAVSYFGIKTTLAANVTINSGAAVEFGQGFTGATACSGGQSITVTPNSSFTNTGGSTGSFYFASFKVSNIPAGCSGSDFTLKAFDSQTASSALSIFNTSSTNAVIYDASGVYSGGNGSSGMTVVTNSTTSFTATFSTPVSLARNVYKITVESGAHSPVVYSFGDSGPAGGIIVSTPNANGGTGGNYYYEASPVDIASSLASCNADESGLTNAYTAIGLGSAATNVLIGICASGGAVTAKNYSLNGFSDWFLPTRDEAVQICKYARQLTEGAASCTGGTLRSGFANGLYVTSSSGATHNYAWHVMFDGSGPTYIGMSAGAVRALRVFSP